MGSNSIFPKSQCLISLVIVSLFSEKVEREKRGGDTPHSDSQRPLSPILFEENGLPSKGFLPALLFSFVLGPPRAEVG